MTNPAPTDLFGEADCPACRLRYPVTFADAERMFIRSVGPANLEIQPDYLHAPAGLSEHWEQAHSGDSLHFPTEAKLRADGYVSFAEWRTHGGRPTAPTAEEIVRALAECEAPIAHTTLGNECGLPVATGQGMGRTTEGATVRARRDEGGEQKLSDGPPPNVDRAIADALELHAHLDQGEAVRPLTSDLLQLHADMRIESGAMTLQWQYPKPQVIRDEPRQVPLTPEAEAEAREIARRWAPPA